MLTEFSSTASSIDSRPVTVMAPPVISMPPSAPLSVMVAAPASLAEVEGRVASMIGLQQ
jgi:hypothetical protein